MRVLVTGAHGFVGSHLVPQLRSLGLTVAAYDGDVREPIRSEFAADVVVHLAGVARGSDPHQFPREAYETNIVGTANVLYYCEHAGARCILSSTSAVYGVRSEAMPIRETDEPAPRSVYALSKWTAEQLSRRWSESSGGRVTILRLFNVYGAGQAASFIVPDVIDATRGRHRVSLRNPDAVRDFVHVSDVVDVITRVIRQPAGNPETPAEIYNVGTGTGVRIEDLAALVARLAEVDIEIQIPVGEPVGADASVADVSRIRSHLGWTPRVGLADGLAALIRDD